MEEKLKIVHFFRSPVGGIFRHVRDLVRMQSAAGHSVGIICDSNTGGDYEDKLFETIRPDLELGLHRISMTRAISPSDALTFVRSVGLLRKMSPDIVHSHSAKGGIHGRFAGRAASLFTRKGIKTFYCPHGGALHYDPKTLKGKIFFNAERFGEFLTDSLIFVCQFEADAYREKVGEPRCDYTVVYNGLAEDEFEPVIQEDSPKDFLYIGMMRDLKGPQVFLDALKIAREKSGKNLSALFVGDGPDKPRYVKQINQLGLNSAVEVQPALPPREAFARARIVVVPSLAESMPYLVLEAIAGQMPIIATDVGGIPEVFTDRENMLVEPENAQALADQMLAMNEQTDLKSTAKTFANAISDRFSLAAMAADVEKTYRV